VPVPKNVMVRGGQFTLQTYGFRGKNTTAIAAGFIFDQKRLHQILSYRSQHIAYYRYGHGARPVICLHGYGENAQSFAPLAGFTAEQFTLYAIDLPLHGHTGWQGTALETDDLYAIVRQLVPEGKVTLLAFSMGARLGLTLFEAHPQLFNRLVLLAPDGIVINKWYRFATQTRIGQRVFRLVTRQPRLLYSLLTVLRRLRLLNNSYYKLVSYFMRQPGERHLLYRRWMLTRRFLPHRARILALLQQHNVPLYILSGMYDKIIPPQLLQRLEGQPHVHLQQIRAGHHLLQEKYCTYIENLLIK
jgi:pimeloyl-ACP methyl ester carboxylesterase